MDMVAGAFSVILLGGPASAGLAPDLRGLGYRVVRLSEAGNAASVPGEADLVVVDGRRVDALLATAALRALPGHADVPILLVDCAGQPDRRRAALTAGATDVLVPPYDDLDLDTRLRNLATLGRTRRESARALERLNAMVNRAVHELAEREHEIIRRLMLAAELRDDQAGDHISRVAACAVAIAQALGLPKSEADDLALASTMHDIGKISIPDHILLKPGPLDPAERAEMQQHATRGHRMLRDSTSRLLTLAAEIALTHHERWDGKGYPQGLRAQEIPLSGRIIAVADVFDALISRRTYKEGWPPEQARDYLMQNAGTHFDPYCVEAFLSRWDDIVALINDRPAGTQAA